MVAEVLNPDKVDPTDDIGLLTILSRTFKGKITTSSDTNQNDMELIKNYHQSVAIKNSENFMEQAREISSRNAEDVNNELPCSGQSGNKEEDIVVENEKLGGKQRRPGLLGDTKRPKFSLKSNVMSSQTNFNLEEMEKEIDKISDPVEYFNAHERLENARKEIQRQTGGIPTNSVKDTIPGRTRVPRPGLGTVRQKHRYSWVGAGSNEVFSSQPEADFSSQSTDKPITETMDKHDPIEESILVDDGVEKDSVAAQNNVNHILAELLSTSCTDLDGDGAVSFLQERLQLKPIVVDKLSLPDLDSFRSISVTATVERAGKSRESLSEMESLIRQSRNKTSTETHLSANTSMYQRASPTSPESPLASVSLLRKRLSQMGQTASPFSFGGINCSPVRNTSPVKGKDIRDNSRDAECGHNNETNDTTAEAPDKKASSSCCEFQSAMLVNDDTAGTNTVLKKLSMYTEDCSAGGPGGVLQDKVEDVCQETSTSQQKEADLEGLWNTDCSGSLLDGVKSFVGEHQPGNGDSQAANFHPMQNNEVEDMQPKGVASEQKEPGLEDLPSGDIDCSRSQFGESISATGKHQTVDAVPQNSDFLTEQNEEMYPEPPSLSENRKRKPPQENKIERQKSRRKSLAETGTKGESEVRRSTRARTRPLEYWKGEQFIDGRVQNESVSSTDKHQSGDVISENPDILAEQHEETNPEPSLNVIGKKKAPARNRMGRTRQRGLAVADEPVSLTDKHQSGDVVSENPDILAEQHKETNPEPYIIGKKKAPAQNKMGRRSTRQKGLVADESVSLTDKHQSGDVVSENPDIFAEQHKETNSEPSLNVKGKKKAPAQNRMGRQSTRQKGHVVADESVSSTDKHQSGDVVSENPNILAEQHEETYQEPSLNGKRKKKTPAQNRMGRRSTRQKGLADETVPSAGKHQSRDVVSENPDILAEQQEETYPEPSPNENRKKKAPAQNRREKQITRRKSLAGAGTKWESGVRRSTRHRVRPLEFWKGERLLFGRVHESLLTVIGVKYESPPKSKKEKPTFRVKSFVSDEYKELVEFAALH